jgi:protein SCO1/2
MQVKAFVAAPGDEDVMKYQSLIIFLATALATVSCEQRGAKSQAVAPRTHEVRGFVRGINFAERRITVEHEDVPGFMPAMTMPFDFRSQSEIEPLKTGDAIAFHLVVTDRTSWIEAVKKIDPATVAIKPASPPAQATAKINRLKEGDVLPDFRLVDERSESIDRATFAGKPLLLTFIFTRCPIPNFCPLISRNFTEIRKKLGNDPAAGSANVQYLSISFDAEFDTPERLATYASSAAPEHANWRFASGSADEVSRLTRAFSVYVQPESGTISHGLCTALIDADGTIRKIWRGNSWEPSEVVASIRALTPALAGTPR